MRQGRRFDPADMQEFQRRMRRGRPWVMGILGLLLLVAWYPFLRTGLDLQQIGEDVAGWGLILLPGMVCLYAWHLAHRTYVQALEDVRRGRVRWSMPDEAALDRLDHEIDAMPLPGHSLEQESGRRFLKKGLRQGGYDRPDRAVALRRLLLVIFLASGFMYLRSGFG